MAPKPLNASNLYDILHRADLEHDSMTGEGNNDRVTFLEEALAMLEKNKLLMEFAENIAERFAEIPEYVALHQYCYLDIKEDMRKGDSYYLESFGTSPHCFYFPQGWCDEFDYSQTSHDGPECYGYAATHTTADSPIETLWIPFKRLRGMKCTEECARKAHPALFEHLKAIDEGKI